VDLVSDRKTKKPLAKNVTRALFDACLRRGLVSMCYGPIPLVFADPFRQHPPRAGREPKE